MNFLPLLFGSTGLIACWAGFSDFNEERRFIAQSKEAEGTIIGLVGAKRVHKAAGGRLNLAKTATQIATGTNHDKEQSHFAGAFIRVEYRVEDYVYTVRSRQNFNEIPESGQVTVQYNPEKPQEAIVEGFYSGSEKYFQMAGGAMLIIVSFFYDFFFG